MLALGATGIALTTGHVAPPALHDLTAIMDAVAQETGFTLARIEVRGHRYTGEHDVVSALAIANGTPIQRIDMAAARERVERLAWVKTAVVQRVLPDGLTVEITERAPAALWRHADRDLLVDAHGRTLAEVASGSDVGLLVLKGEGAGLAAGSILTAIASHGEIARRLVEARRIAQRRWTLQLTGGTLVHLPGDGADAALAWLDAQVAPRLLDSGLDTIDLRVPGQLVVRRSLTASARQATATSPVLDTTVPAAAPRTALARAPNPGE